jgi:hypothetical protein
MKRMNIKELRDCKGIAASAAMEADSDQVANQGNAGRMKVDLRIRDWLFH